MRIGCDLHARQQTLAMLDTTTGDVVEVTLKHEGDNVREFYSSLPRRCEWVSKPRDRCSRFYISWKNYNSSKFLCGKPGKAGRKTKKEERKRDGIQTAELDRRDQVTATKSWPNFPSRGREVDNQVAAPTESSTPNLHRAKIAQQRVRMEGWRQRRLG